jgi:hypothetical protein
MADAGGPMTRSRIEAFDQTAAELMDFAYRWRAGVTVLEQAVESYVRQIDTPNGTE